MAGSFQGIYFNTGQACNAGSRLFVQRDQFDEVVGGPRRARRQDPRLGAGLDPGTQIGPVVSAEQRERVLDYIESAVRRAPSWSPAGGAAGEARRLLRRADAVHRHQRRPAHRPGGDLRPGAGRARPTSRWRRWQRAPTTPSTAWPRACGPASVGQRPPAGGAAEGRLGYVNSWGISGPGRRSAATRARGSAASTAGTGLEAYLETKTVWTGLA